MAVKIPFKQKHPAVIEPVSAAVKTKGQRVQSVDLIRGLAIVLMALDHVRDYFHYDSFYYSPTDLAQTSVPVFFTRFITNFCAPVFCLLAGTSAFFVGQRISKSSLSVWLLKRGLVLVLLEFTVVNFGWYFRFNTHFTDMSVIWCLGMSMIFLAGLIHLPKRICIAVALTMAFGHNLLDTYQPEPRDFLSILWSIFHIDNAVRIGSFTIFIVYPLLPWIGIITLGYFLGQVYLPNFEEKKRKRFLFIAGLTLIGLFCIFRISNIYGDLHPLKIQNSNVFTILSVLNVTKYPPSFSFICITIGPTLLFLAAVEHVKSRFTEALVTFGQVPMFFYIFHLYFIHALAVIAAVLTGYDYSDMLLTSWVATSSDLKGYGFNLPIVYLVWLGIIIATYPDCKWYRNYKRLGKQRWWFSYI